LAKTSPHGPILVVGLGRFGSALALTLTELGVEVMAIDSNGALVQRYADRLTHTVEADSTDESALRQLGVPDFHRAVVGIGEHMEASILTVSLLSELGVREIWAQAVSKEHARILQRVGADHVIAPEADMGVRVAHLVGGRMLDYIEFGEFAMSRTEVPREAWGKSLADAKFRAKYGVTVVAINPQRDSYTFALPDTVVNKGDILVVAGTIEALDRFSQLD
jgi:trk system potassium uptake protein TrkA